MKRNWDLVRTILIKLEEKANPKDYTHAHEISGYDALTVAYHYKLLGDAGLIEVINMSGLTDLNYSATMLTWQGHEFLDKIRNETVWNKVKSTIQSKSLDLSFDAIKTVATTVISSMLG